MTLNQIIDLISIEDRNKEIEIIIATTEKPMKSEVLRVVTQDRKIVLFGFSNMISVPLS